MSRLMLVWISAGLLGVLGFCSFANLEERSGEELGSEKITYQKITAEQAKALMEESADYILLDVRTEEEFQGKRIDGAMLIPDFEINQRAEKELSDKDALILVYCRSGRRSAEAAGKLADMGYTHVYDFGGILDWPYETTHE